MRPLTDVLMDLAVARDAHVTLVRAQDPVVGTPNEDAEARHARHGPTDVLRDEFEGLMGLLRY